MFQMLKTIVILFLSFEMTLTGMFNGITIKNSYDMPEIETGEYTQYVDSFIGTGGLPWTCGMLSTAASVPFGLVRLGADTSFIGGAYLIKTNTSGYFYEHHHIEGFSHSRLSGTGAEEYEMFRVTPAVGKSNAGVIPYSHEFETAVPGYYAVYLQTLDCLAELTATAHAGVHRYTFGSSKDARLSIDVSSFAGNSRVEKSFAQYDETTGLITGGTVLHAQFSGRYDGLPIYFAAKVNKDIKEVKIKGDETDLKVDVNFGDIKDSAVELKLGISFVSVENALLNLETEVGEKSFDDVRAEAQAQWEDELSLIKIDTADEDIKTIFYTSLYRTMIMPSDITDANGEYLGFDKQVHVADGYTYRSDMSLWDTVRNTHALYTLIEAEVQNDCLNSLVEMAKAGGALPRWPQGAGYSGSMFGDSANIMITESYLKGYTDFDVETAYEYMKKSSDGAVNKVGREFVNEYNTYGYVPEDIDGTKKSVSRTLEYAWQDGAIADLATALGYEEDAEKYTAKSMFYKNTFNPENHYFMARNSDGSFVKEFSPNVSSFIDEILPVKLAKGYCEGSAQQWRWSATHDIDGMIELFGSEEYFVSELEAFMEAAAPTRAFLDPGAGFWVGNQHDIHTPYLFSDAGRDDLTEKWVRWTLADRFSTDINGLDGNDDGGTLSAWYVFSSMGFYPLAGSDKYWIGSPNLDSAEITLSNGNTLKMTALNQSASNVYVKSVTLNGEVITDNYLTHAQLMGGGELVFTMSANP